ncbi:large terminase protein [Arthrobacter sp. Hiyo8]|nr:large terminase protein [Arthrobacter sp. Hiyo8]
MEVLGRPLWPHQLEVARSKARYRVICAGRQVGKSTTLSTVALFEAATRRNITVLLVSAGEVASRRLLEECQALAHGSPLLGGSVLDDSKSLLTLSNGSRIISVPASSRQIRGWPVDVLILDEAGFIDTEIWRAAEPAIIARPGSRVILVSTPWGDSTHFFRALWQRGMDAPDEQVESWHWPSSVSPLVDEVLLEQIRQRESSDYFRREFLAEWTDAAGAYFTEAEIMDAVADYATCPPADLERWLDRPYVAAGGVDWGYAQDANALTLVSVLEDYGMNRDTLGNDLALFIPWFEVRHNWPYSQFIDRIVETAGRYYIRVLASETNGVGQYPTEDLRKRSHEAGRDCLVSSVVTDVRRKQSGFSMIKGLLQRKRLVLPRDPELLKQLRALEFEQLPTGNLRIAVPDRAGHDDLAMSFMQAVSCIELRGAVRVGEPSQYRGDPDELVRTKNGLVLPRMPRPVAFHDSAVRVPRGLEKGDAW